MEFFDSIYWNIILFLIGTALIIKGADWLTDGASSVARKFNVSTLIIGLTIVAFGTSMPELVVSTIAAVDHHSEMAIGNVVGSNIFNTLAIVGATALVCPVFCKKEIMVRDIPVNIGAAALLILMVLVFGSNHEISRIEGVVLLIFFAFYLFITIRSAIKNKTENTDEIEVFEGLAQSNHKNEIRHSQIEENNIQPMWKSILFILVGLGALIGGGELFVEGASAIAIQMGVSESIVALTIVSAGTSFPELATSVAAARKGDTDMAIGNVVGSNIFNIMFILGVASTITPLQLGTITTIDFIVMAGSAVLILLFILIGKKKHCINRLEGALLTLCMIAYYTYLVLHELGKI